MHDTSEHKQNALDDALVEGGPYAEMIGELVASGRFNSAAEVVLEGLALVREQELARKAKQEWLRAEVQKGIDEADRGDLIPMEEVFASLRSELASRASS